MVSGGSDNARLDKGHVIQSEVSLIDCTKSDSAWDRWLQQMYGQTVLLLVYEYGLAITKGQDIQTSTKACIVPAETDRAGVTAESVYIKLSPDYMSSGAKPFKRRPFYGGYGRTI
ncbi:hypothetical protein GQ600_7448 [Phytophthora cactorum]|nr:hypothetical protein GQ600_7448 [Phytophthora cactorum]